MGSDFDKLVKTLTGGKEIDDVKDKGGKDPEEADGMTAILEVMGLTGQAAKDNLEVLGGALDTELLYGSNAAMAKALAGKVDPRVGLLLAAKDGGNTGVREALEVFRDAVPSGSTPGQVVEQMTEALPPQAVAAALRYHVLRRKAEELMLSGADRPQRFTRALQSELPAALQANGVMQQHGRIAESTFKRVQQGGSAHEKALLTKVEAWADALADENTDDAELAQLDAAVEEELSHMS